MSWPGKKSTAAVGLAIGGAALAWRAWNRASIRRQNQAISRPQRVVVLGAGFAGMNAARELSKLLLSGHDGEITLIDRNNFLLFTPMLTEVAGGELDARHIVAPPRRISPRVRFEQGMVKHIDLAKKSVTLQLEPDGDETKTLIADQLVIALGSVTNYHDIPGLQEHSFGVKTIGDAIAIRDRVLACLERADAETDPAIRRELLTFVVGGGGYTGVETMAAIHDLARGAAGEYPNLSADEIRAIIAEPGERLLAELSPDLATYAQGKLQERGVTVLLKTKIASASRNAVQIEPGGSIPSRTLIWAGGVKPNPLLDELDCKKGHHGGISVNQYCAVPEHSGIWAIGDCAEIPKPEPGKTYAPTAQNATREGELVARNIVAVLRGRSPEPFKFTPIGELALVGRHSGVATIYGYRLCGFPAWAMWRAIYLSKMPGMGHRSRILADWVLDAIFGREVAQVPAQRELTIAPAKT